MIRWDVAAKAARHGWTNAYQLAQATGISQPAAKRVLHSDPIDRIDVGALQKLARAFKCKPWSLLEYTPDE